MKNRFGYEWSKYSEIIPLYEMQFKRWTSSLAENDWKGKSVLDAGCGTGRNSIWPVKYGAASVTAFDIDPRTVAVARKNLSSYPSASVHQHSIFEIPWTNEFDIAFSIGVIHHLHNPRKAVSELVKATKPGGLILIWVYGKEGATTVKSIVNGIRKVTCRIPPGLLNLLVIPFSIIWWLLMKFTPSKHPYFEQFKKAHWWHVHSILFDQLLPEIANYWTENEAKELFTGLPIESIQTVWVNNGSWSVYARKKLVN